jgi:hypothetical protein
VGQRASVNVSIAVAVGERSNLSPRYWNAGRLRGVAT